MSLRVNILATLLLGALQSLEVKNLPCGLVQKSTTYSISKKKTTSYIRFPTPCEEVFRDFGANKNYPKDPKRPSNQLFGRLG